MSSCFDLPEDVLVQILCHLPVKSLIRFTSVSKRWRSVIISDPHFGKCQFQLALKQRTLCRKFLLTSYPMFGESGPRLRPRFQSLEDKSSVKEFIFPYEENEDIKEMGSCNGLLFLGQKSSGYYKNLCIWNLSTGFFRKIPSPSFQVQSILSTDQEWLQFVNYGFGQELASDDYKLVFVIPAVGGLLEVHVFSLRTNIWKVITAPYSSWPGWSGGQGTFLNGAIHWVIGGRNVCAFDLAEEGFRQMSLPPVLWKDEDDDDRTLTTTMAHLGGNLCIWCRKHYWTGEVWAMREYGVHESWVKLFRFNAPDLPDVFTTLYDTYDLLFVTESGTMVIRLSKDLFWIECRDGEKPVCSGRYKLEQIHPEVPRCLFYFHAIPYDETLVSVPELLV